MAKPPPLRIKDVMTRSAHAVKPSDTIATAKELMQFHAIRHLPVVDGRDVVGVLSLGDLYATESVMERDPDQTLVASAMASDVYSVDAETTLGLVVSEMARRKIGSVIVTKEGALAGIFTSTDVCRLLGDLLRGGPFA